MQDAINRLLDEEKLSEKILKEGQERAQIIKSESEKKWSQALRRLKEELKTRSEKEMDLCLQETEKALHDIREKEQGQQMTLNDLNPDSLKSINDRVRAILFSSELP